LLPVWEHNSGVEGQMVWLTQIVFWIPMVTAVVLLLVLLRIELLKGGIPFGLLRKSIVIMLGLYILQIFFRMLLFYLELKKSPIGVYLLPGKGTTFFTEKLWMISEPLFLGILIGLFFIFIILLVKKYVNRPLFEENDPWIIFLVTFIVGYPNIYVLLIGSLLIMVIFKILQMVLSGRQVSERLQLVPFFLLTGVLILVLSNFSFYSAIYNLII